MLASCLRCHIATCHVKMAYVVVYFHEVLVKLPKDSNIIYPTRSGVVVGGFAGIPRQGNRLGRFGGVAINAAKYWKNFELIS